MAALGFLIGPCRGRSARCRSSAACISYPSMVVQGWILPFNQTVGRSIRYHLSAHAQHLEPWKKGEDKAASMEQGYNDQRRNHQGKKRDDDCDQAGVAYLHRRKDHPLLAVWA